VNQKKPTQLHPLTRHFSVLLSPTPRGARLARLLAAEWLRAWGVPTGLADTAARLVAEPASNAASHDRLPGRSFRLALHTTTHALRIEVTDTRGDDLPHRRPPSTEAVSGRGLLLVEALADRWGVARGPVPRKTVWTELRLRKPEHDEPCSGATGGLF
jgi:anti-sigma regulatory factor (Ser/Thr protein kinase)